ncbi:MAG: SRPBCC domain-containing protein, partial [Bradyrhizobium sp.]
MNIETFKPAIVYAIYIAATPEKVWQALTDAELSRQYFSGNAVEVDLRVGGGAGGRAPARAGAP